MIDIKSFSKPKKSGNGSGGGSSSVTYISGIASEADHATRADKAKKAEVAEQANVANRATSAQTASYASKAGEVDIESETLQKFLRKDDPAEGEENVAEEVHRKVDFKKAATFEEAADMLKKFTAHELAAFLKGFTIAGQFGIDEYGDMILNTIKSLEYNNAAEQGFSIEKEDPNRDEYHQYITNLTVWGKMTMNELEVMKRTYAGGTIYLSPAGGKIAKVVPVYWDDEKSGWKETASDAAAVGWKCYLLADDGTAATENLWREGDQVRCQTMGRIAAGGSGQGSAANKSYWRTILEHGVSQQNEKIYDHKMDHELFGGQRFAWIVIGKHSVQLDEYAEENAPAETRDIPEEGDVIVLDGSRTDPDRQNVFLLESHGSYAPRLVGYHGIDSYSHANKDVCDVSPKGVQVRSEYFKLLAQGSNTSTVEIPNFRGAWNAATLYYKNDQVSHNNAIWTCIKDADFQKEPTDDSTYWRKEVYGQKGEDGSSFKVLGTAVKHFTNADDIGGELLTTKEYLFDDTSGLPDGVASPCIATYMKVGAGHLWIICKSNDGDSYMIGDDLWTNSGTAWLNIGNVKGVSISSTSVTYGVSASGTQEPSSWSSVIPPTTDEYPYLWTRTVVNYTDGKSTTSFSVSHNGKDGEKGETGDKGADAITIQLVGAPLIFDAGSDGIVPKGVTNYARLHVTVGEKDVSEYVGQPFRVSSEGMNVFEGGYTIDRREYNGKMAWYLGIKSDAISKVYLSDNKTEVSATSGYITFAFVYGANQYVGQLPFQVNVAMYTGELTLTNKQFEAKMHELSTNYDNLPLKTTAALTDYTTSIKQTAREISLSVSEKTIGRRNLLVGSAFQRDDNNRVISDGAKIEMNSGYQGTNCIHVNDTTEAGSPHYVGAYWDGSQNGRSIKIKKGKKYTMSCFYKTNDINAKFSLEAIYTNKQENATRLGQATYSSSSTFTVKKVNEWELFTVVVDTADAKSDYIAFNFWEACNVSAGQIEAWICRPMVEEGDTYNGWTLSTEDYDYVGGNMLDNTRTLTVGGNLDYVDANTIISQGFGYDSAVAHVDNSSGSSYKEILLWETMSDGNISFQKGKDYLLSFLASGSGKMTCYLFCNVNNTSSIYSENNQGYVMNNVVDGTSNFTLSSGWKRYWVHFRVLTDSPLPTTILMRASIGTNVYIAQPKLEEGAVVTEYTERKSDLVDKASLKKAGIEVKSDEVILFGDKIRVDNNGQTAAMFIGGKLNAAFIAADKIEVKHLWAKSNDGASKVGYFGNTEEDACKIGDYTVAPLFIGGATAKESPFYVTSKGAMHATSGKIGYFTISPNGELMYDDGYTDVAHRPFGLSKEALYFTHTTRDHKSNDAIVWVGRTNFSESSTGTVGLLSDIWIDERVSTPTQSKACLFLSAEGYTGEDTDYKGDLMGNFAIYAKKGAYAGFRPAVRFAIENCQLTDMDCVIYVSVTGVYLILPDNPQRGQYYKFIQGAGSFHIKSSSKNIYSMHVGQTDNFTSDSYNQITEIIWIGDHWRINWFRESVGK